MASGLASGSRAFRLSLPGLRPTYSEENVPLNLGIDEDEASPVQATPPMHGRDAWNMFSLGPDDDDAESVIGEGDFDCHICLQTATNPCVTRCGHLFCYEDLEQWLRIHPRCPVCSATITITGDVVKIFGRGREPRRQSSISSTSRSPPRGKTVEPPPSSSRSLPSPPATPSPARVAASLPSSPTDSPSVATAGNSGSAAAARLREAKDTFAFARPMAQAPPHPLLVEQLLRHQFARILSLVALVFFLLLLGLHRS